MQKPSFKMADGYSYFVIFTFLVSFYGFLVPLGSLLLMLIFSLRYCVDKWNLFKNCSEPAPFSLVHFRLIIKAFEFNVLLTSIGYLYWQPSVHFGIPTSHVFINLANVIFSVIFVMISLFLPSELAEKMFWEK